MEKNEEKAFYWYKKAADMKHAESQRFVAIRYRDGLGVSKNNSKYIYWMEQASYNGDPEAQAHLGAELKDGNLLTRDYEKAVKFFKMSAEQNDRLGQFYLALMYEKGRGTRQNTESAIELYEKSANQGLYEALVNLAYLYCYGNDSLATDTLKGIAYYNKAIELDSDSVEAQYQLALLYDNGIGVNADPDRAYQLYKQAADQGHSGALNNINYLITIKKYVPRKPYKTSFQLAEEAAINGSLESQYALARKYFFGDDVKKDLEKALYWYEKSANNGYIPSKHKLGLMYYKGDYVEKDLELAFKWLESSAKGDADILFLVADMLEKGNGTEINLERAFKYYSQSAKLGNTSAKNNLGILYAKGEVVEKNLEEAEKWFMRSSNDGYEEAEYNLKLLQKNKETSVSNNAQGNIMNVEKCPNCYNTKPFTTILKCSDCGKIFCTTCFNAEPRGSFAKCGDGSFPCSETTCKGCGREIGMIEP